MAESFIYFYDICAKISKIRFRIQNLHLNLDSKNDLGAYLKAVEFGAEFRHHQCVLFNRCFENYIGITFKILNSDKSFYLPKMHSK